MFLSFLSGSEWLTSGWVTTSMTLAGLNLGFLMVFLMFSSETTTLCFLSFDDFCLVSLLTLICVAHCVLSCASLAIFLVGYLISAQTLLRLSTSSS